jgi:RNA polymerase-binding transcription factor DksA
LAKKNASTKRSSGRSKAAKQRAGGSSARVTKRSRAKATTRKAATKKKASAKRTASSKKATSKKTTTRKKTAKKPAASSKPASKKAPAKKASSKKASTAKKPTAKKAPAKKPASKASSKKASSKETTPKKAPAKPAAPAKAPSKKAGGAKAEAKAPDAKSRTRKRAGKGGASANGEPIPVARELGSLIDARAAASRLAAAAGLPTLKARSIPGMEEAAESPRLTKSPLGKRDLEKFRKILLLKRAQVAGDVTDMELEALGGGKDTLSSLPQHMADQGSDAYDQSLSLGLAASQRELLREIDAALERIDNGTYGICEALGTEINQERLEATPWSRYSVEGARMMDRGRGRS